MVNPVVGDHVLCPACRELVRVPEAAEMVKSQAEEVDERVVSSNLPQPNAREFPLSLFIVGNNEGAQITRQVPLIGNLFRRVKNTFTGRNSDFYLRFVVPHHRMRDDAACLPTYNRLQALCLRLYGRYLDITAEFFYVMLMGRDRPPAANVNLKRMPITTGAELYVRALNTIIVASTTAEDFGPFRDGLLSFAAATHKGEDAHWLRETLAECESCKDDVSTLVQSFSRALIRLQPEWACHPIALVTTPFTFSQHILMARFTINREFERMG